MGDGAERIHLSMTIEAIVASAAYTGGLENEWRAGIERVRRYSYGPTVVKNTSVRLAGLPLFTWINTGRKLFPLLVRPS